MDEFSIANICDIEGVRGNHLIGLHKIGDSRFVFNERDQEMLASEDLKNSAILTNMEQTRYGYCLKVDFHLHPASGLFMKKITESLLPDRMLACMREVRTSLDDQLKCGYVSGYKIDCDTATIILPERLEDPKTRIYEVVGRLTGRLTIYFCHLMNRGNDEDVRKQLFVRCMAVERSYTYGKSYPDSTAEIGEIEFPRFPDYLDSHPAVHIIDDLGIPVICYGLRADFQGNLLEGSHWLLAWADTIEEIKTVCWCGRKATYNARISDGRVVKEGAQIQLGGNESYVTLCRKHWAEGRLS